MMTPATLIDLFRDYAKNQLKYHQNELEIRYKNPSAASVELVGEEFKKQQRIFEKELTDKIDELLADDTQFLRPALQDQKNRFLEKLRL